MRVAWSIVLAGVACGRVGFDATGDATTPCTPVISVVGISSGDDFRCAQVADGTLRCSGDNSYGQLGDATKTSRIAAYSPLGLGAVTAYATGVTHACAISNGALTCWGGNLAGQLGTMDANERTQPTAVTGVPADVIGVAAGGLTSCTWTATGDLWCWGQYNGTVGYASETAVKVMSGVTAAALGTSHEFLSATHGCAIRTDHTIACWGANGAGQLGDGTTTTSQTPVAVSTLANATQLALGSEHSCALISDGHVWCWGNNDHGQLGDGSDAAEKATPTMVSGLTQIVEIAAHDSTTCARDVAGAVACWGNNDRGQLATAGGQNSSTPRAIPIPAARTLAIGLVQACALASDGVLWCWGSDRLAASHTAAVTVAGLGVVDQLSARSGDATCAHRSDNTLACWGHNTLGQLGDGTRTDRSTPTAPLLAAPATEVSTGYAHSCARHVDGSLECWGDNECGQLADAAFGSVTTPQAIVGLGGPGAHVAAGGCHTCALLSNGELWCWGLDSEGRLGHSDSASGYTTTPSSSLFANTQSVIAGDSVTCTLDPGSTMRCSGRGNEGEVGIGGTMDSYVPAQVRDITTTTAMTAGAHHTCAISAGSVWCWGDNVRGQIGDGSQLERTTPVQLTLPLVPIAIASGADHTCAIFFGGAVECWGDNGNGQLGDGTFTTTRTPVVATELTNAVELALGQSHTCARMADGSVRCVGSDAFGQLGTGAPLLGPAPRTSQLTCPTP